MAVRESALEALNREQLIVNGVLGDGLVREASRKKEKLELGRKKLKIIRVRCAGRALHAAGTTWAKAQRCDNTLSSNKGELHDSSVGERG